MAPALAAALPGAGVVSEVSLALRGAAPPGVFTARAEPLSFSASWELDICWANVFFTCLGMPSVRDTSTVSSRGVPARPGVIFWRLASIEATSATISLSPGLSALPGKVRRMVLERRMKLTSPKLLEESASRKKALSVLEGLASAAVAATLAALSEPWPRLRRRSNRPIRSERNVLANPSGPEAQPHGYLYRNSARGHAC